MTGFMRHPLIPNAREKGIEYFPHIRRINAAAGVRNAHHGIAARFECGAGPVLTGQKGFFQLNGDTAPHFFHGMLALAMIPIIRIVA